LLASKEGSGIGGKAQINLLHCSSIAAKPDLSGFNYPTNLGSLAQADSWRENKAEIGIGKFPGCGITAQHSSLAVCYLLTRAEIPFCFSPIPCNLQELVLACCGGKGN
jgi:hypothetical protein